MLLLLRSSAATALPGPILGGGVVNGPTVYAPTGPAAAGYVPRLTLWIIERDGTPVVELPASHSRSFTPRNDGTGGGSFSVQLDDPDAAEITYGRLARFFIDGRAVFTMLLGSIDRVELAQGEEVDEVITVVGGSTFHVLEEGIVAPGPGAVENPDARSFNLSTPSGGSATVVINGTPTPLSVVSPGPLPADWSNPIDAPPPFAGEPINFPVDLAAAPGEPVSWVTAPGTGPLYFIQQFDVPADPGPVLVSIATTGAAVITLDGTPVAIQPAPDYARGQVSARVDLPEGPHTLGVVVAEPVVTADPPAVIGRVTVLDPGGRVSGSLAATGPVSSAGSSSTVGAVRSTVAPATLTAGAIVAVLVGEAQDRGCFPDVTLSFTGRVDTDGTPWPTLEEFVASVGDDNVATVVAKLTEAGAGYFRMAPGQMRLDGYATLPASPVASLAGGVNLTELKHEGTG